MAKDLRDNNSLVLQGYEANVQFYLNLWFVCGVKFYFNARISCLISSDSAFLHIVITVTRVQGIPVYCIMYLQSIVYSMHVSSVYLDI